MQRLIIDTDPGHDDAIALLLAFSAPGVRVEAVTTVAGNQTVEKTTANALKVLTVAGKTGVRVAAGMGRPLLRPLRVATSHGESGLDGPHLPAPAFDPDPRHAVDVIREVVLTSPEPATIVALGPLTNIATALLLEPRLKEKVSRIVLMGGAYGEGNTTPVAEFNIFVDPEAAQVVFHAGVPVTMVGLNVTHRAIITHAEMEELGRGRSPVARMMDGLFSFYRRYYDEHYDFGGVPVHDACAVAEAIWPGTVRTELMNVEVETQSNLTRGQTVCDALRLTGRPANVHVGVAIDVLAFKERLFSGLRSYEEGWA